MAQLSFTKQETSHGELKWWSWDNVTSLLLWEMLLSSDDSNVLISCNFAPWRWSTIHLCIFFWPFFFFISSAECQKETRNFNVTTEIIDFFFKVKKLRAFRKHNRSVEMYKQ